VVRVCSIGARNTKGSVYGVHGLSDSSLKRVGIVLPLYLIYVRILCGTSFRVVISQWSSRGIPSDVSKMNVISPDSESEKATCYSAVAE
jgi:hypothetical protein